MDLISAALHTLNIGLTSLLLYVYSQNYSKIKSKYTIGLMIFAGVFLAHSALGLYFDATMVMFSTKEAEIAAMILEGLKAASFVILLKISWE